MTALPRLARRPGPILAGAGLLATLLAFLPGEAGTLAARAAVAALAVAAVAVLARRRTPAPPMALRIGARVALGRSTIAVVEVDGRRFLLGAGDGAPELIAELAPDPGHRTLSP